MIRVRSRESASLQVLKRLLLLGLAFVAVSGSVLVANALGPDIAGSSYRFYENADSATPGSALAATDTAAQISSEGGAFRLRMGVTARGDAINYTKYFPSNATGCAIANGKIYCSGANTRGEIGDNSTTQSLVLVPTSTAGVLSGKTVTDVAISTLSSASQPYTCAIADARAYCWGSNSFSALGTGQSSGTLPTSSVPLAVQTSGVLSGVNITDIAAGDGHACVAGNNRAYCWGVGGNGRLGNNSTGTSASPVAVYTAGVLGTKNVTAVAAGSGFGCAIADGQAYCWGINDNGQLGNGNLGVASSNVPVAVDTSGVLSGKTLVDITGAASQACAIDTAGQAYCWGLNTFGQLGNNSTTRSEFPVAVTSSGLTFTSIKAGIQNTCATTTVNDVYCWGNRTNGAIGNGLSSSGSYLVPTKVTMTGALSGHTVTSLEVGTAKACVIADAQAYCWGGNSTGSLGFNNTATSTLNPTAVLNTNVVAGDGVTIAASAGTYKLQYAPKTAGSCSAQSTGFADVTTASAIAWNTNPSVANDAAITTNANDPIATGSSVAQAYRSSAGSFSNGAAITQGKTGLWDFSLIDNSGAGNKAYCMRLVTGSGTVLSGYNAYPEIRTAVGSLSLSVRDSVGSVVSSPSFALSSSLVQNACQSTTGQFGSSAQRLRISNTTSSGGWSTSIAATGGATASWSPLDASAFYDFNDPSGSPPGCNSGSDGDGIAGQLSLDPAAVTAESTPQSGCTNTGVNFGSTAGFNQGTVNSITLISASSGAPTDCYWEVTGIGVAQTIPASQAAGIYLLSLTATVVAQ